MDEHRQIVASEPFTVYLPVIVIMYYNMQQTADKPGNAIYNW